MLYAIYPRKSQNYLIFSYENSINYFIFDEERKIEPDEVKIVYELLDKNKYLHLERADFIFTNGPVLVSDKVKDILEDEIERGFVQFFNIEIINCDKEFKLFAMYIIHQENVTNLDESIYELEGDDFEFDIQILKIKFDWDLTIAKSKEVPFQIVINDDIKDRFLNNNINNVNLYSKIDSFNDKNSEFIKL
ncbi:hypothetical protein [Acinetobacter bereziniae]|uniref:hypothetical protein n=2 Tax=Acinetobacter bereziniae TaxID=106648 RepID=UPI001ABD1EE9|nr:hypothetical protein [Acinetobacter bereziniae]MBO3655653.1 hypothetical protein [Acinetobacter bereziniae]